MADYYKKALGRLEETKAQYSMFDDALNGGMEAAKTAPTLLDFMREAQ
ncbi:MAG: hypothetical protein VB049_08335 [Candidatus Pelethousia sp.]|nr:hypothetical protein [Candidatus Pelethousia sp.]